MKRTFSIALIIIFIIALAVGAYFLLRGNSASPSAGTTENLPPVATSTTSPFPTGNTFSINTSEGGVTVKNFYNTKAYATQDQQTVVLAQNDSYTIDYYRADSSFGIGLLSGPFQATRNAAESVFLSQLGVSKSDACKLTVDETVLDKSSQYNGELIGLSFCPGAIPIQ